MDPLPLMITDLLIIFFTNTSYINIYLYIYISVQITSVRNGAKKSSSAWLSSF